MVTELNERNTLLVSEKKEMKNLIQEQEQELTGGFSSSQISINLCELFQSYLESDL